MSFSALHTLFIVKEAQIYRLSSTLTPVSILNNYLDSLDNATTNRIFLFIVAIPRSLGKYSYNFAVFYIAWLTLTLQMSL